jgi:hypothetical protein
MTVRLSSHVFDCARLDALRRLDKVIIQDDLSGTLEQHRDSNRASVIRPVYTNSEDPEVLRPSFLKERPFRKIPAKGYAAAHTDHNQQTSSLHAFGETVAQDAHHDDGTKRAQLTELRRAAERAREQQADEEAEQYNRQKYAAWTELVRAHESPLLDIPEYDPTNRTHFFALMRRCYTVLRAIRLERTKLALPWSNFEAMNKDRLLYRGLYQPFVKPLRRLRDVAPWSRRPLTKYGNKEWLRHEMTVFAEWMAPTPSEKAARAKLSEIMLELVAHVTPHLAAEEFGSQTTGLTMPDSDIDIRIYEPIEEVPNEGSSNDKAGCEASRKSAILEESQRMQTALSTIQSHLAKHPDFAFVKLQAAHFPLVEAVHKQTQLRVQIVSTKSSEAARTAIGKYMAEFPQLKTLYPLIKTTLALRAMNKPWCGGFGSYTIFMMCVAALKLGGYRTDGKGVITMPDSLLCVLKFWSNFKFSRSGITLTPPKIFGKRTRPRKEDLEAAETDLVCFQHF